MRIWSTGSKWPLSNPPSATPGLWKNQRMDGLGNLVENGAKLPSRPIGTPARETRTRPHQHPQPHSHAPHSPRNDPQPTHQDPRATPLAQHQQPPHDPQKQNETTTRTPHPRHPNPNTPAYAQATVPPGKPAPPHPSPKAPTA